MVHVVLLTRHIKVLWMFFFEHLTMKQAVGVCIRSKKISTSGLHVHRVGSTMGNSQVRNFSMLSAYHYLVLPWTPRFPHGRHTFLGRQLLGSASVLSSWLLFAHVVLTGRDLSVNAPCPNLCRLGDRIPPPLPVASLCWGSSRKALFTYLSLQVCWSLFFGMHELLQTYKLL